MQYRIADTFTESLAKLNGEEQRAAKTTAFDLQLNPAQPGLQFHRVDRARDKNFWSVRVNKAMRMIVHKTAANLLLCYVGEHDDAYRWAERRLLEQHPHTGAAQLVEIREVVREIEIPRYVAADLAVVAGVPDSQLLHTTAYSPSGSMTSSRFLTRTRSWPWRIIFPPRRPGRCWNWLPGVRRSARSADPRTEIRSTIPMRNAASESCPTRRTCAGRWSIHGRSGQSFCARLNDRWWTGPNAPRARVRICPKPARRSWPCIAPCIFPTPTQTHACRYPIGPHQIQPIVHTPCSTTSLPPDLYVGYAARLNAGSILCVTGLELAAKRDMDDSHSAKT